MKGLNNKSNREEKLLSMGPDIFEQLFDEINDSLYVHDFEGNILYANNEACNRLGYSKSELTSMNVLDISSDYIRNNFEKILHDLQAYKKYTFESTILTKDKKSFHVEVVSKIVEIDGKQYILASSKDITLRKKYELQVVEAKREAEEQKHELKAVFNNSPSTIFLFDEHAKLLRINEKGISKFNLNKKEVIGKRVGNILNCSNLDNGYYKCNSKEICKRCQFNKIIERTIQDKKMFIKNKFHFL